MGAINYVYKYIWVTRENHKLCYVINAFFKSWDTHRRMNPLIFQFLFLNESLYFFVKNFTIYIYIYCFNIKDNLMYNNIICNNSSSIKIATKWQKGDIWYKNICGAEIPANVQMNIKQNQFKLYCLILYIIMEVNWHHLFQCYVLPIFFTEIITIVTCQIKTKWKL